MAGSPCGARARTGALVGAFLFVGGGLAAPAAVALPGPAHEPFGALDIVDAEATGGLRVVGWALDPDVATPVQVHVYLDGVPVRAVTASVGRPDVDAAVGLGPDHGYDTTIPAGPGSHEVCTYAINEGAGTDNVGLGCRTVVRVSEPFGVLDETRPEGPGTVFVQGWAADPDTPDPIAVTVSVDGVVGAPVTADELRPDVDAAYPGVGRNHGFALHVAAPEGRHTVCVLAANVGPGSGESLIGCRSVVRPSGVPQVELFHVGPIGAAGEVVVDGAAVDPDTDDPVTVHVYFLDPSGTEATVRAELRYDAGTTVFPGFSAHHGFSAQVTMAPGTHTLCAQAFNTDPAGFASVPRCAVLERDAGPT